MKIAQNKMNNSSCGSNRNGSIGGKSDDTIDSAGNQGDLRELKNQGDVRDVTERSGNKNRINMVDS